MSSLEKWIFGEKTPVELIDSLNDHRDVEEFAQQARIRAAGGLDAIFQHSSDVRALETVAEQIVTNFNVSKSPMTDLLDAISQLQQAAELRGAWTSKTLKLAQEASKLLNNNDGEKHFAHIGVWVYGWREFHFDKRFLVPPIEDTIQVLASPSMPQNPCHYVYCAFNSFTDLTREQNARRVVLRMDKSWLFKESNFATMSFDHMLALAVFFVSVSNAGGDPLFVEIEWLSSFICRLNESAFSEDAFAKVAKAEPGAYDGFYKAISKPVVQLMLANRQLSKRPKPFNGPGWYARAGLMFAFSGLPIVDKSVDLTTISASYFRDFFQCFDDEPAANKAYLLQYGETPRAVATFQLITVILAASFSDWKLSFVVPEKRPSSQRTTNICIKIIQYLYSLVEDLDTGYHDNKTPALVETFQHKLQALHVQIAKQLFYFGSNIHRLTEESRMLAFWTVKFLYTCYYQNCGMAPLFNCEPFWKRFLPAARMFLMIVSKADNQQLSTCIDNMITLLGLLGCANRPKFVKEVLQVPKFDFGAAIIRHYSAKEGITCVAITLRSATKEQLQNWATSSPHFLAMAKHLWVELQSLLVGMSAADITINVLISLNAIFKAQALTPKDVIGASFDNRVLLFTALSLFIQNYKEPTDLPPTSFLDLTTFICNVLNAISCIFMKTLYEEDIAFRKIFLKRKADRQRNLIVFRQCFTVLYDHQALC